MLPRILAAATLTLAAGLAFVVPTHPADLDPVACAAAVDDPTDGNLTACHGVTLDFIFRPAIMPPSWSAGYESAYLAACHVLPVQRAAWASADTPASDPVEAAAGRVALLDDLAAFVGAGGSIAAFCDEFHP